MLGPVARSVNAPEHDVAERDLGAVLESVVGVVGLGGGMNADRELVLEREPTVAGDVVGVRVRLHDSNEPNPALLGFLEVLLDRKGRIDDDCLVRALVSDEVRGASERLVDELREDHSGDDASTCLRYLS